MSQFDAYTPTWCPGCGDWGIRIGIKTAFEQLKFEPSNVLLAFDIGCSGNMNDFLNGYAMHTLHGRSLATAMGMKTAHHDMKTVVIGGDGGLYGEGGNHFIHSCRGNHDITVIVHDNMVYGLTKGQTAPTAEHGYKSSSTPQGLIEMPINPLALAISQGATFVAQGFAGDIKQLVELMKLALSHKGFALMNVLQPCVTFNKINTYHYYLDHAYKIEEGYDPTNLGEAMKKSAEIYEEKFPLGVIYQSERPAFHEQIPQLHEPLVNRERYTEFDSMLKEFI